MKNDFEAQLARLKQIKTGEKTEVKKEDRKERDRKLFERPDAATKDNTKTVAQVEDTKIFQILADSSLESAQKVEQISELLLLDFADPENAEQSQALSDVRTIISALIEDFTLQTSETIQKIRDNPLAELTTNVRTVFENYKALLDGREDLQAKLMQIQSFMDKNDGDLSKLMEALKNAQNKKEEKERLEVARSSAEAELDSANDEVEGLAERDGQIDSRISELAGSSWFSRTFNGELKTELKALESEKTEIAVKKVEANRRHTKADQAFRSADSTLTTFMSENDFRVYEEILELLDIGDPQFKQMLKDIANQTLQYIQDTKGLLSGSRAQLHESLQEIIKSLDTSINTSEKIAILKDAMAKAQDTNAKGYTDFQAKVAADEATGLSLGTYENKRIESMAMQYTAEMTRSIQSTTEVDANVMFHRTTLAQAREDLENGVANADSQLLKAVATSAMTGQTILQRTERLAAMSQKVIADTMYDNDLTQAFGEVVNDFETQLRQQMQANSQLGGYGELVRQLAEALDSKNDVAVTLAQEQVELVERLNTNLSNLEKANERQSGIAADIASEDMKRRAGNDNGAASPSSAPSLKM